jgi:hypothetical protein
MIKSLRAIERIFAQITLSIHQIIQSKLGERGMVPFMSLDLDADSIHRIIEMDYELGENIYGKILDMFRTGIVAPVLTIPFQILLPTLERDDDVRLLTRIALNFYWPILMRYQRFLTKVHQEPTVVFSLWLPEGGYSQHTLQIVYDELAARCREEKLGEPHLVILLDNHQCSACDSDILMKSWNIVSANGRMGDKVSVVFRDRTFSDWVTYSNPSVKKLLDRTIAKADSELNALGIDYCWAHFEDLYALCFNPKTALNFEQKIVKLTELGYLPVSADIFVRRKLVNRYLRAAHEPQIVQVKDRTGLRDWHLENVSLGRWTGLLDSNADSKTVDANRPYTRKTEEGKKEEPGSQSWKIAFNQAMRNAFEMVRGEFGKSGPGMLQVLAELVPSEDPKIKRANVERFLVTYSHVYWREHFLNFDLAEGDLNLRAVAPDALLHGLRGAELTDEEIVIAGTAAQAFYFALSARDSFATVWENFDQRAVYQAAVMASLALVNAIHVHHWLDRAEQAAPILAFYRDELIGFAAAFDRYNLARYGVAPDDWRTAIKSEVPDSPHNAVERAARRIAARHLRDLNYKKEFPKTDENLSTNVGHIWTGEMEFGNFIWENPVFCGTDEE